MPLSAQVVIALALGVAVGALLGPGAAALGELGKLVIQLVKAAAAPLLFLSIVNAILKTEVSLRGAGRMAAIATFNASVALAIGLTISNVLKPGLHLPAGAFAAGAAAPAAQKLDLLKTAAGFVPVSFVQPFAENAIIMLVILALLLGFGLRKVRAEQRGRGESGYRVVEDAAEALLAVTETVLGWVIMLVPLAVFGVVAKAVGEHGLAPLRGLGAYVGVGLLGLLLHCLITYQLWLALYVKMPLGVFWRGARQQQPGHLAGDAQGVGKAGRLQGLFDLGRLRGHQP